MLTTTEEIALLENGAALLRIKVEWLEKQNETLAAGIRAVRELIENSVGVHGDFGSFMPWDYLERGGRAEKRLTDFHEAEDLLKGKQDGSRVN